MADLPEVFKNENLPEKVEDLAKFVLIAPEVFKAQQAEIRAMEKVGVAKEIMAIKEADLNRAGQMYMDAKVRLGRITRGWEGRQGQRTDKELSAQCALSKQDQIEQHGLKKRDVYRFEKLSRNEDCVEAEKQAAAQENRLPSDRNVLKLIREKEELKEQEQKTSSPSPEEPEEETQTAEQIVEDAEFEVVEDRPESIPLAEKIKADFEIIDKTSDIREGFAFIELLNIDKTLVSALTVGSSRTAEEAIDYLSETIRKIERIQDAIKASAAIRLAR